MKDGERSVVNGVKQAEDGLNPFVKLALEIGPLAVFFIGNAKAGIFFATGIFMVAATASVIITYLLARRIAVMPLVTAIVVLVFGGLTLMLQDELFIKLKPTIVNLIFAAILGGGLLAGRSLLQYIFDSIFEITEEGWRKLTIRWTLFFVFLALLNEFVWRNFSTDFWVNFKVFGMMPVSMIFTMAQLPLINRYAIVSSEEPPAE